MYLGCLGEVDPNTITSYDYTYSGTGNMCNMWGNTASGPIWQGLVPCPPGIAPAIAPAVLVDPGLDVSAGTRVALSPQGSSKLAPVNASPLPPASGDPAPSGNLPMVYPMPGETGGGSNLTPVLEPGDQTKVAGGSGTAHTVGIEGDGASSGTKWLLLAAAAAAAMMFVKRARH